jgi:surface polysaccharide O-acyltransferase-like enzyme
MIAGGAFQDFAPFTGGFYWQSVVYTIWECFFGMGVCLGLLALFRESYNNQNRLSRFLSENYFGVYVFHTPITVGITMLLEDIRIYPLLKMVFVSLVVLPVCYGFSFLIKKIPFLNKIF